MDQLILAEGNTYTEDWKLIKLFYEECKMHSKSLFDELVIIRISSNVKVWFLKKRKIRDGLF